MLPLGLHCQSTNGLGVGSIQRVNLKTFDHLNVKLLICSRHTASLKDLCFKVQDLENLNFTPCIYTPYQLLKIIKFELGDEKDYNSPYFP